MIRPTINYLQKSIAYLPKMLTKINFVKKTGQHVFNNNRTFIDGLGVSSIVAKDGLGCYYYVTQSLNNKEIPDEQRSFVASLDLTNGLLMIGLQLAMFLLVNRKITPIFNKCLGKHFDRPVRKAIYSILKNNKGMEDLNNIEFIKKFAKIQGNVKDAFGGILSLVAASIVGKRILVPLIATPLAGKVETKMKERQAKKAGKNPTMEGKLDVNTQTVQKEQTVQKNQPASTFDTGSTSNLIQKYKQNHNL